MRASILFLLFTVPVIAQPPASGLILWLDLMNHATATTATDQSGNGNNGTFSAGTIPWMFAPKALTVPGFGAVMPTTTATVVIAFSNLNGNGAMEFAMNNGTSAGRVSAYFDSQRMDWDFGNNATATNSSARCEYLIPSFTQSWTVWALTVSPGAMAIWQNGVQRQTTSASVTSTTGGDLVIGDWVSGGFGVNGMIADFAVYSRVLNPTEIAAWDTYVTSEPRNQALINLADNGLARKPPMGWASFYAFGPNANETQIKSNTDLVASTLSPFGYSYIGLDGVKVSRVSGTLQLNSTNFPSGGAGMGTYIHGKGLKMWYYGAPGMVDCQSQAAEWGFENTDANTYASWGVDYYKYDWCNAQAAFTNYLSWSGWQQYLFQFMAQQLRSTGRPIIFTQSSLQYWYPPAITYMPWQTNAGLNISRTTLDMCVAQWSHIMSNLEGNVGLQTYTSQGHWLDGDYIMVGMAGVPDPVGSCGTGTITDAQGAAQMSMWSILAMPLIAGVDLNTASATTLATLTNLDVIAIDQDSLGVTGQQVSSSACGSDNCEVWARPLSSGYCAIALLNKDGSAHSITATFSTIAAAVSGCGAGPFNNTLNVWANWPASCTANHCGASMGTLTTNYTTTVPATSVFLFTAGNTVPASGLNGATISGATIR